MAGIYAFVFLWTDFFMYFGRFFVVSNMMTINVPYFLLFQAVSFLFRARTLLFGVVNNEGFVSF